MISASRLSQVTQAIEAIERELDARARQRKREANQRWRARNPDKARAHSRRWKQENAGAVRELQKKSHISRMASPERLARKRARTLVWQKTDHGKMLTARRQLKFRQRNPGQCAEAVRQWTRQNITLVRERNKERKRRGRLALSDEYIKHVLESYAVGEIPSELVEAKREHIRVKRLLKEEGK